MQSTALMCISRSLQNNSFAMNTSIVISPSNNLNFLHASGNPQLTFALQEFIQGAVASGGKTMRGSSGLVDLSMELCG